LNSTQDKIIWFHSKHVADVLAEDFPCVFRARVPSDDYLAHVAVDLMDFVAISKLNLIKRLICDNTIGGLAILLFFRCNKRSNLFILGCNRIDLRQRTCIVTA
jgi:hypothetical protein